MTNIFPNIGALIIVQNLLVYCSSASVSKVLERDSAWLHDSCIFFFKISVRVGPHSKSQVRNASVGPSDVSCQGSKQF